MTISDSKRWKDAKPQERMAEKYLVVHPPEFLFSGSQPRPLERCWCIFKRMVGSIPSQSALATAHFCLINGQSALAT